MQQNPNMFNQPMMQQQAQKQNFLNQNLNQIQQQQNNQPNTQPPNSNFISVLFKLQIAANDQREFTIHTTSDEKVSELISKFRTKAHDTDLQHEKFIFNAKRLNMSLTVAEAGLSNNSIIYVINDKDLKGGITDN